MLHNEVREKSVVVHVHGGIMEKVGDMHAEHLKVYF